MGLLSLTPVKLVLAIGLLCVYVEAQDVVANRVGCSSYLKPAGAPTNSTTTGSITKSILLWQAIVLLICFGAFALFISLIHRIVRTYIYYDAHLLDTFFDGGGDMSFGLIACSVVAKWVWTASYTQSTASMTNFGLVGPFWYAAGACIHLFLFSIVVAEIRIKAPGAKTYLQIIHARYGPVPHVILMVFAFITIIMVSGMVMLEGVNVLTALTQGLGREVTCIVLAIVIGFFTVVGGVGGGIYVAYFACALIFSIMLVYFTDVFYDPLGRDDNPYGNVTEVYNMLRCAKADEENEARSAITFLSRGGMIHGILLILSSFTPVFVDQSFWQSGIAGKPSHSVWGFMTAGLVWFALPLCVGTALGSAYWGYAIEAGNFILTEKEVLDGLAPVLASQKILGNTGDFLMFTITMVAVVTTASSEVLAASSIIIYDIYQTYISPFNATPIPQEKQMTIRMQRAIKNEEYLEYDRRCVVLKHVVVVSATCLLIPITLIFMAMDVDLTYLYMFTGIIAGSCVLPIALAITWHRITGAGIATGVLSGFLVAIVAWLVYGSTFEGGLTNFKDNTREPFVLLVGNACALGVGGLLCIIVSLSCGGCDNDLQEEEEWEKTRQVDNPIIPWSVKYAPDIGANHMTKGKPHFYTVRRTFKCPEISSYICGVLLAVTFVLVWPACMLIGDLFSTSVFNSWIIMALIWGIVATVYIILVPLLGEIIQVCRQAYYNRMWTRNQNHGRLHEEAATPEPSVRHEPPPKHIETHSIKSESELQSTIGRDSTFDDRKERWKTFIHLD